MTIQTTQLAGNMASLKASEAMLQNTVAIVESSSGGVRSTLQGLLDNNVQPLITMSGQVNTVLSSLSAEILKFAAHVARNEQATVDDGHLEPHVKQLVSVLDTVVPGIAAQALAASELLTQFQNTANSVSATLNSYNNQLLQDNAQLQLKVQDLQNRMQQMTGGNCCEQIGHAFEYAFGSLKQDLENTMAEIDQEQYQVALNSNTIDALNQVVATQGDIAKVAGALEISWRSLADNVATVQEDLDAIVSETTRQGVLDDLAYVQSEWQAIVTILEKVS